ncbi:unnamed protein product, partial [Ixodes pacificus]
AFAAPAALCVQTPPSGAARRNLLPGRRPAMHRRLELRRRHGPGPEVGASPQSELPSRHLDRRNQGPFHRPLAVVHVLAVVIRVVARSRCRVGPGAPLDRRLRPVDSPLAQLLRSSLGRPLHPQCCGDRCA